MLEFSKLLFSLIFLPYEVKLVNFIVNFSVCLIVFTCCDRPLHSFKAARPYVCLVELTIDRCLASLLGCFRARWVVWACRLIALLNVARRKVGRLNWARTNRRYLWHFAPLALEQMVGVGTLFLFELAFDILEIRHTANWHDVVPNFAISSFRRQFFVNFVVVADSEQNILSL